METSKRCFLLSVVASVTVSLLHSPTAATAQTRTGGQRIRNNDTEFIRQSCSSTFFPAPCYASLAPYASIIAQDRISLALVATNISLTHVRSVSFHVSALRRTSVDGKVENRTVNALKDCEESLGDAADLTGQAARELGGLASSQGTEVAWRVSNAQTWVSAALTNEDTCVEGFTELPHSIASAAKNLRVAAAPSVEEDVCGRVRQAKQYTSIALALVNSLVATNR